jgi:hypothetical protein
MLCLQQHLERAMLSIKKRHIAISITIDNFFEIPNSFHACVFKAFRESDVTIQKCRIAIETTTPKTLCCFTHVVFPTRLIESVDEHLEKGVSPSPSKEFF